jgi:hypothetical protein
VVSLQQQG